MCARLSTATFERVELTYDRVLTAGVVGREPSKINESPRTSYSGWISERDFVRTMSEAKDLAATKPLK